MSDVPERVLLTAAEPAAVTVRVDTETIHADSVDQVCCYLIDGYADTFDEDDRLTLRAAYAAHVQHHLQQQITRTADLTDLDDPSRRCLDRGVDDPPPAPAVWDATVPLVVVATDYQPWIDIPYPTTSNDGRWLWVIDPTTADTLLHTLDTVGYLRIDLNVA